MKMLDNDKKKISKTYTERENMMNELSSSINQESVFDKEDNENKVYGNIPNKNVVPTESIIKPKVKTYTKKKFN